MAETSPYGKKPRWGALYRKHFPDHTDGASRHVKCISEQLRDKKDPLRKLLMDAGYEPDHMARSMETTVIALWTLRDEHQPQPEREAL
jgi:hypothetical protein